MSYLKLQNETISYPYYVEDLLKDNPSISFPFDEQGNLVMSESDLLDYNVYIVHSAPSGLSPSPWTQRLEETTPVLVNGKWTRQYIVVDIPQVDLDHYKTDLINKIKEIRDHKTENGGFKVGNNWFHSNTFSRTQHIGLMMVGSNIPANLVWKCMDGSFVTMTPQLAASIFSSAVQQDTALFAHAESLIDQIKTVQNPSLVDINAGWPETYNNI